MRSLWYGFVLLFLVGCGTVKKKTTYSSTRKVSVEASKDVPTRKPEIKPREREIATPTIADAIVKTALSFSGTRYKYGGTTRGGMDCSGLLYVAFGEHDVALPRISYQMAEEGTRVNVRDVEKGDLLFFKTTKRGRRINHVGLVVAVDDDDVQFVHASTSRGVIVSSLREGYWNYAFVKAARIL